MQIKQDPEIKRTVCYENNSIKANCFFYASNEPKSVLARDLGDCRDNERQRVYASNEPKSVLARAKVYCFSEIHAVDFLSISCACKRNVLMET